MNLNDFKAHINPIKDKLFRFSLRIVNDPAEAEDVVQEVFIKLWEALGQQTDIQNVEAWCMRAARNRSIDKLRSKHKRVESLDNRYDQQYDGASPFETTSSNDTFEQVRKLMADLPEKQRQIMHLRDIEGYTYQEIADALDLSIGQVKVNLFRARQRIRLRLLNLKIIERT